MEHLNSLSMTLQLLWYILLIAGPFVVLAIAVELLRTLPQRLAERRAERLGISDLDYMTGREFEVWLASRFKALGYEVKVHRGFKDKGADMLVRDRSGRTYAVQAKKRDSGSVGVKVLGEVLRGMRYYNCDGAIVVTNQKFTEQTWEEARKFGVLLWDRRKLIEIEEQLRKAKRV